MLHKTPNACSIHTLKILGSNHLGCKPNKARDPRFLIQIILKYEEK